MEIERNCSKKFWELMRKRGELARIKLKQKLSTEVTTICDIQRRLKEKKIKQQERADEYRNELEAMKQRVRSRALIVEQQEMLIKMQRFERKYKETVTGTPKKTRKICIQNQQSNRFKERVMMINSDQQTMMISGLDQSSNEMQTTKTETNRSSLLVSDIDDNERGTKCVNHSDNIVGSNGDDNYYSDYDDDEDDDSSDDGDTDDDDDGENEESESENDDFDKTVIIGSKNSESSSEN